jgi:hypothetical protein
MMLDHDSSVVEQGSDKSHEWKATRSRVLGGLAIAALEDFYFKEVRLWINVIVHQAVLGT